MCGHMMFFNTERYHSGDEPILFNGSRELEATMEAREEKDG